MSINISGFRKCLAALSFTSTAISFLYTGAAFAQDALPNGANVASGTAIISVTPNTLTVNQSTPNAIINWNTFSVAQGNQAIFNQPNAQSATLNRVTGSTTSTIAGQIISNGAVYIVNPNGIAITSTGNVQTAGGFVASALDISDQDFNTGRLNFRGQGASGRVSNSGNISAGNNAYVALLGGNVANSGTITVPLGRVGLGSAERIALDLNGDGFMQVSVPTSALTVDGGSQIDMPGIIAASGGRVELRAATVKDAVRNVINMPGSINADSALGNGGSIILFGGASEGDWGGTVTASGDLSARATGTTGDGGFIETSGANVDFDGLRVNAAAASGKTGTWLIDPTNLTVDASAAATIGTNLANANVTLQTTATTTSGPGVLSTGAGDININSAISWASANTLTLDSFAAINLNAPINASLGGLTVNSGSFGSAVSATAAVNVGKFRLTRGTWTQNAATLPSFAATDFNISTTASTFTRAIGGNGTITTPYLIADVYGLQGMASGTILTSSYGLANNIDATGTVNWNAGLGFIPIGTDGVTGTFSAGNGFTGSFNGNGFSISGLTINRPAFSFVGVFGALNGSISNVNLLGGSFRGGQGGAAASVTGSILASMRGGSVTNVASSANVTGASGAVAPFGINTSAGSSFTGGIIGLQLAGSVSTVSSSGIVTGGNGGNGSSSSSLVGVSYTGGLVGFWTTGTISQSFATGVVTGGAGGSSTSTANGGASSTGGLVGILDAGEITSSYSNSNVTGGAGGASIGGATGASNTGGLAGRQSSSSITQSYYKGNVVGGNAGNGSFGLISESFTGGLVGASYSGSSISSSNSAGTVRGGNGGIGTSSTGGNTATGGLVGGTISNTITDSFSNAAVTGGNAGTSTFFGQRNSNTGGFVGLSVNATMARNYATGIVAGAIATGTLIQFSSAGGFAGTINGGTVAQSYASGAVTGGVAGVGSFDGASAVTGGFTGYNSGSITQSYATGRVVGGVSGQLLVGSNTIGSVTGGFAGYNFAAGSISQAYASGQVTEGSTGAIFTGGFIGNQEAGGTISNTYWDSFSTTRSTGFGTNNGTITNQLSVTSDPAQSAAANYAYNTSSYANFTPGAGLGTATPTGWVYFDGQTRPFLAFEVPASGSSIINAHQLQLIGLGTSLSGTYTLGKNIDLSETGTNLGTAATSAGMWRSAGWVPLGTNGISNIWNGTAFAGGGTPTGFSGSLNGGGFTISGLRVNRPTATYVGLYGFVTGSVNNMNLTGLNVTGRTSVGGLAGYLFTGANINSVNTSGIVSSAFGAVTGSVGSVGGLVGVQQGASISNSSSAGSVSGASFVGGLVGYQFGTTLNSTISNSSSSANASGQSTTQTFNNTYIGGLVGYQRNGTVNTNVFATGTVTGSFNLGGLVGVTDGNASPFSPSKVSQLTDTYATGNVSGTSGVGGLVGSVATNSEVLRSYANGTVTASNQYAGGLAGILNGGSINQAYATGSVLGVTNVGGLIGIQASATGGNSSVSNAYATGTVTGTTNVGGLVGRVQGAANTIRNSYAIGLVNNNVAGANVGGLIGSQASITSNTANSYWNISVNSALNSAGGTGLTTAQMQDAVNFLVTYTNWDFTGIWEAPNQAGQSGNTNQHYPRLKFNLQP